jgi:O-antigen/teichoic acid export membrane protein
MRESVSPQGFGNRVRSAVFWRSGSQIVSQIISWVVTILVVRLLDPKDYGLFAMSQVVLVMLNFLNGYSFASALIRAESIDSHRIRQTFGLLILLNGGLALVQFMCAPLAAAYFHQPIIARLLRWQALLYLPTPFIALPSALLARGLDFKKQAITNLAAAFASAGTALGCALAGWGVWTLVAAPIVGLTARAIGLTIAARLLVWPSFNFKGARDIVSFGGALILAQFFWIIQSQTDISIGGRVLDPHSLGLYAEALFLTQIFTAKFLPPLNEVAFPSYAELAKAGGAVGPAFITAARLIMAIALPLYAGLAVVAGPLVATAFGPKWLAMAPLVALLALAMPFWTLQIMFAPATNALGQPNIYARTNGLGALILATCFLIGIHWGVHGLVCGWLIGTPLLLIVTARLSLPIMGTTARALFVALLPNLLAAGAMALVVATARFYLSALPNAVQLLVLVLLGAITYLALLYTFARGELSELVLLVTKRKLPQRVSPSGAR